MSHWPEVIASAWPLSIIPADHRLFLLMVRNRPGLRWGTHRDRSGPHHAAWLRRFAACGSGWSVRQPSSVGVVPAARVL